MTEGAACTVVVVSDGTPDTRTVASLRAQSQPAVEVLEVVRTDNAATGIGAALASASADFVAVVDSGDELGADALARIARHAQADVVYSDEDRRASTSDDGEVFFKPDWSPDRLRAQQYVGGLCALRRSAIEAVGGVEPRARGAWQWDLLLRLGEAGHRVEHVPEVLYHRAPDAPIDGLRTDADRDGALAAVRRHLERSGVGATVEPAAAGVLRLRPALHHEPTVSIVVPTAGTTRWVWGRQICLVLECVRSIVEASTYSSYEVVCVVDTSVDRRTRDRLLAIDSRVRLVDYDEPFNFSRKINLGVRASDGEHVVLLNDDTQVITPSWLEEQLVYSMQPGVGAVGATLRFADRRIQHVGVVLVNGDPGHPYYGYPADTHGYFQVVDVPSNQIAVTAACLMTPRAMFEQVGGFGEELPANYNDVDFCLKLHVAGARIVRTPGAELFHFESSSRTGGPVATFETELLRERWGATLMRDPFYSPRFLATADYLTPITQG